MLLSTKSTSKTVVREVVKFMREHSETAFAVQVCCNGLPFHSEFFFCLPLLFFRLSSSVL